ncbi:MAG: hypothetical protein V5A27_01295 [Halapricum sp.]
MSEYIGAEVKVLRDSTSDDEITLLFGVSGDRDEFARRVEEIGATVDATVVQATLRVTAPESAIDQLCELEGVQSIEIEREDVRTLDEGNGQSRRRVARSARSTARPSVALPSVAQPRRRVTRS